MQNETKEMLRFISNVDQLFEAAKHYINSLLDKDEDCDELQSMISYFSDAASFEAENDSQIRLKVMGRFAIIGVGKILQSISEEEITKEQGDE